MATYPKDRFDALPDDLLRVGAHRGPAKKGRGWIAFAWAVLATVVLVAIGLFGLNALDPNSHFSLPFFNSSPSSTPTPTPTPTPTAKPKLDPTVPIDILNGTTTASLASTVGDDLVAQGWTGAGPDLGSRADAATKDIKQTVVYYLAPADEAAARALVLSLKVGTVQLSDAYPGRITVVLGSDYKVTK